MILISELRLSRESGSRLTLAHHVGDILAIMAGKV